MQLQTQKVSLPWILIGMVSFNRIIVNSMPRLCQLLTCRSFTSTSIISRSKSEDHLLSRQSEMMARGLPKKRPLPGVGHIVLVASGKGGVGKSTTAVNLAVSLKMEEPSKEVGLLDADVFGPSIPLMMNLQEPPLIDKNNLMIPLQNYGIKCMSMGFLIEEKNPVIWRGLTVMQALDRLLRHVAWNPVDYLVIDTPPGTGDTHLSLIQNIPISGVVLVTTPQVAALEVTRRGGNMFKKLEIPIIGIVQNMSTLHCPQCHSQISLYGKGTSELADELKIPLLEDIPLDKEISKGADEGIPVVISSHTKQALAYRNLAKSVKRFLESNNKNNNKDS